MLVADAEDDARDDTGRRKRWRQARGTSTGAGGRRKKRTGRGSREEAVA